MSLSCIIDNPSNKSVLLRIDKNKMSQVLRNFLTNAIKFTPREGKLSVKVSVKKSFSNHNPFSLEVGDKGIMRVEVVDTGPGISKVS